MYPLIMHCIALFFAACVIGFDTYFLIYPTTCFFSLSLCNSTVPLRGIFYSEDHFNNIKIPLLKGQLATAAVMVAFSIDYIIMYASTSCRMTNVSRSTDAFEASYKDVFANKNDPTRNRPKQSLSTDVSTFTGNTRKASSLQTTDISVSTSTNDPKKQSLVGSSTVDIWTLMDNTKRIPPVENVYHSRWSLDSKD
jgi:hypothetical protein